MTKDQLPRIGECCRVWHGPGFTRSGRVIDVDEYNKRVLVEYDYNIPNEWVAWSKLC
jgi:hypothetical protein